MPNCYDIKAVIFDMDGLMFDTERVCVDAWLQTGREYGVEVTEEMIVSCCGLPTPKFLEWMTKKLPKDADILAMDDRSREIKYQILGTHGVPKKAGLDELLEFLRKEKIPVAIATSTEKDMAMWKLEKAGVLEYFHTFVCGDEIENGKPDPDIYLTAAKKLGVDPANCLALEDAAIGAMAALSAGMRVIMVPDLAQPDLELEGKLFAKLESLGAVASLVFEG
ncbi:MAG: HAD family phosphatase [Oscillospiraceae bacterium]|nr:HAD family phosphatase [Oscillospiraceae bacterium]